MSATLFRPVRTTGRALLAAAVLAGTVAAVPAVTAGAAEATTSTTTSVETRNPLSWPFARDSIWNTPIGSSAAYVPAGLQPALASSSRITVDPEHISVDPNAPIKTLQAPGQPGHGAQVRVAPDLAHNGSWNGCSSLLTADGKAIWQGQPLQLTAGGDPSWKWTTQKTAVDLRGQGIEGCHGGSHMSGLGGSIRVGELDSPAPIRHALKINVYCKLYCYNGGSATGSKRWPALTADAYWATGYAGKNPALKMGALLALPPSTDLSTITNPKARKIAEALRDFGGYVVDDTFWDVHALSADKRVKQSGEWPTHDTVFHAQLQQVFTKLAVVDNNTATSVGGGGTRRAPLAPCFSDDTACIDAALAALPAPSPAPSPTTTTSPAPAPTTTTAPATSTTTTTAPTTPPAVDTPLSALAPVKVVNGWGPMEKDRSNGGKAAGDGRTLTIGGRTYAKGLGVHARSEVTYALDGKYAHFTTAVGVDDEVGAKGTVVFEIWVDGVLKQRTPRQTGKGAALSLDQSVYGAKTLRLVVTDAGDGNGHDHADWANPYLWVTK